MSAGLVVTSLLSTFEIARAAQDSWPALIVALIFVGGVMVLLVYVSSVAQNDSFYLNPLGVIFSIPVATILSSTSNSGTTFFGERISLTRLYSDRGQGLVICLVMILFAGMLISCRLTRF